MISAISTMLTCRWSARRIQRYLDADPSALLAPHDVHRLEEHLATCRRCVSVVADYRGIRRVLAGWSQRRDPDPAAVARLRVAAERILLEDAR